MLLLLSGSALTQMNAQTTSSSSNLTAQPVPDRTILFSVSDTGVSKPITWGLDMAWLSEANIRRGIAFMGKELVDVVRSSFTPTDSLVNGDLKPAELATLNQRLSLMNLLGANTVVMLNDDPPTISSCLQALAGYVVSRISQPAVSVKVQEGILPVCF